VLLDVEGVVEVSRSDRVDGDEREVAQVFDAQAVG